MWPNGGPESGPPRRFIHRAKGSYDYDNDSEEDTGSLSQAQSSAGDPTDLKLVATKNITAAMNGIQTSRHGDSSGH
jgi:hypothetical protein